MRRRHHSWTKHLLAVETLGILAFNSARPRSANPYTRPHHRRSHAAAARAQAWLDGWTLARAHAAMTRPDQVADQKDRLVDLASLARALA
jgi:hypothetical protein